MFGRGYDGVQVCLCPPPHLSGPAETLGFPRKKNKIVVIIFFEGEGKADAAVRLSWCGEGGDSWACLATLLATTTSYTWNTFQGRQRKSLGRSESELDFSFFPFALFLYRQHRALNKP